MSASLGKTNPGARDLAVTFGSGLGSWVTGLFPAAHFSYLINVQFLRLVGRHLRKN